MKLWRFLLMFPISPSSQCISNGFPFHTIHHHTLPHVLCPKLYFFVTYVGSQKAKKTTIHLFWGVPKVWSHLFLIGQSKKLITQKENWTFDWIEIQYSLKNMMVMVIWSITKENLVWLKSWTKLKILVQGFLIKGCVIIASCAQSEECKDDNIGHMLHEHKQTKIYVQASTTRYVTCVCVCVCACFFFFRKIAEKVHFTLNKHVKVVSKFSHKKRENLAPIFLLLHGI